LFGVDKTGKITVNSGQDALQFVTAYSKITASVGLIFTGNPGVSDKAMISTGAGKGFSVVSSGSFGWDANSSNITDVLTASIGCDGAASIRLGLTAATGTPVAQTLKGPNGTAGQTNQAGGNLTISSGLSTGNGAASVIIATSGNTAASTALNTAVTRLTADASGVTVPGNLTVSGTIMGYSNSAYFGSYGMGLGSNSYFAMASSSNASGAADTFISRAGAASTRLGIDAASGTPLAQTLKGPNGTAGQTNQAGGNLTISSGLSTGSGAASVIIATSGNTAASTALNTAVTRLTANASGIAIGSSGTPSASIKHGTATLVAGTVTVSDSDTLSTSRIFVNRQTDDGTVGDSYSITRSAGVSFTITSKTANMTATLDTSTVSYLLINP